MSKKIIVQGPIPPRLDEFGRAFRVGACYKLFTPKCGACRYYRRFDYCGDSLEVCGIAQPPSYLRRSVETDGPLINRCGALISLNGRAPKNPSLTYIVKFIKQLNRRRSKTLDKKV